MWSMTLGLWSRFGVRKEGRQRLHLLMQKRMPGWRDSGNRSRAGMSGPAVLPLVKALNDEDWCVRWETIKARGDLV